MKPDHIWNKPSLTPELWPWTHYLSLMRYARNRLSKQLSRPHIINLLKKKKFLARNYTIPLKMKTKPINCLMMQHGNVNVQHKTVIKNRTPILTLNFRLQTQIIEGNRNGTLTTNITNHKLRETDTVPVSHRTTGKNKFTSYPIYNWCLPPIIQGTMEGYIRRILGITNYHPRLHTGMANYASTSPNTDFIQRLQHFRPSDLQKRNPKPFRNWSYRRIGPFNPMLHFHPLHSSQKDWDLRPVIDLRVLNGYVKYQHFKMESLDLVKSLIRRNDYMISIDLNQAFYHVPLASSQKPFFAFDFLGKRYCFRCLPFGLTSSPRIFTKVLRPLIKIIRSKGIRIAVYLDDILLMARSKEEALEHTTSLIQCLQHYGFTINEKKSLLAPSHVIDYLEFRIDSK